MRSEPGNFVFDVIVVGAGPTGLTLTNALAQAGLSVLLIEQHTTTVQEPRAVSIDDESLRTIQSLRLLDVVMPEVVSGYGSRYLSPDGRTFLSVLPTGKPYGHPRRNAFRQPVLEQQLRDGLNRFDRITCRFGSVMQEFSQDSEGVTVQVSDRGVSSKVRGRYMVGCDGGRSEIRKKLGIELQGETLPERWLIIDLEDSPALRDTTVFCDSRRPCIALPGPRNTRRFEFKLHDSDTSEDFASAKNIEQLLASKGVAPGSRMVRSVVYTFHARVASRWSEGRVFIAGDAAHLSPPFAGQGMNSGIRDAHNLAWKLAEVINGRLSPHLLDTYELERRDHVRGMIDLALWMGRIMAPKTPLEGWLVQTLFRLSGLWPAVRAYFGEMKYKPKPFFSSGFLISKSHPLAGRLVPQPMVRRADASEVLLDEVLPAGFVLVGIDVEDKRLREVARQLSLRNVTVSPVSLASNAAEHTGAPNDLSLGSEGLPEALTPGSIYLIRPDRYVITAFDWEAREKAIRDIAELFERFQVASVPESKRAA